MFDLSRFIDACRTALRIPNPAIAVQGILSEAVRDSPGIEAELGTEVRAQGESAQYVFLHQAPDLTILKVVMPGHHLSPPHNHLIWAVIGLA